VREEKKKERGGQVKKKKERRNEGEVREEKGEIAVGLWVRE
jgi:hypothetical protein